ncbi:hypothetical protein [Salinispira pacifica]|uniref:Uncharacterized protein n=1 Tax=Salinispira pacifica TaxID=1307761 RepID=V5WDR3_9SPIO|nr:hypothetical protein [Salinispira pacifica]AHC13927.1 hypothetical protein L21SP2_0495 [Salinispira pacifica]
MFLTSETEPEVILNFANRIRGFLLDNPEFRIQEPKRRMNLQGGRSFSFSMPGVDFDSIIFHGHSGLYHREVSRESNWISQIIFNKEQTSTFELKPFRRYAGFIVSSVEHAPERMEAYFSSQQIAPLVPLVIPILQKDHCSLTEEGEIINGSIKGSLAVYAPPGDEGERLAEHVYRILMDSAEQNSRRFTSHGIRSLEINPPKTMSFPEMAEASGEIRADVDCNIQDDSYWTVIY